MNPAAAASPERSRRAVNERAPTMTVQATRNPLGLTEPTGLTISMTDGVVARGQGSRVLLSSDLVEPRPRILSEPDLHYFEALGDGSGQVPAVKEPAGMGGLDDPSRCGGQHGGNQSVTRHPQS